MLNKFICFLNKNFFFFCFRGALTNKTYFFNSRPWELKKFIYYDIFDSFLNELVVEHTDTKIVRVVPSIKLNRETYSFISDKSRFFFDGLFLNRILKYIINTKQFVLQSTNCMPIMLCKFFFMLKFYLFNKIQLLVKEIIKIFNYFVSNKFKLFGFSVDVKSNVFFDYSTMFNLKNFMFMLGLQNDLKKKKLLLVANNLNMLTYDFVLNKNIILWDLEPRFEIPSLNFLLRTNVLINNCLVFSFGKSTFTNFKTFNVGFLILEIKKLFLYSHIINLISNHFILLVSNVVWGYFNLMLSKLNKFNVKVIFNTVTELQAHLINNLQVNKLAFSLFKNSVDLSLSFFIKYKLFSFEELSWLKKCTRFKQNLYLNNTLNILFSSHGIKNISFINFFDCIIPVLSIFEYATFFYNIFGEKKNVYRSLLFDTNTNKFTNVLSLSVNLLMGVGFIRLAGINRLNLTQRSLKLFINNILTYKSYNVSTRLMVLKSYKLYYYVLVYNYIIYNFYKTCCLTASSINLNRKSKLFELKYQNYSFLN